MRYLKRYEIFINRIFDNVNTDIDKNLSIIEGKVLNDFSTNFWELSMNSSVFTTEEKFFIKENLISNRIDLVNEGWLNDTLGGVWNKAREKGGEIYDKVKTKIKIIKDNIKKLISGITEFIKQLFKSLGNSIIEKSNVLKDKVKGDFPNKVKAIKDPNNMKIEINQLKSTVDHLKKLISDGFLSNKIESADDSIINDTENQISELETELKKESIDHDILKSFYIIESDKYKVGDKVKYKMKDGGKTEKEIIRIEDGKIFFHDKDGNEFSKLESDIIGRVDKIWNGFSNWFLDMEKATPPDKNRAVWWIKLVVKIIGLILSPIVKIFEVGIKYATSNVLKAVSYVTKKLDGPGVFEFTILGGFIASFTAMTVEFSLVSHKIPEPWSHIFEVVSIFLTDLSGVKGLLTIFGCFCLAVTLYQLIIEYKHLFYGHGEGHDENHPIISNVKGDSPAHQN